PEALGQIRVCIVSYAMARLLFQNLSRHWSLAIVDESHCLRTINGRCGQGTSAILELLKPVARVLLLSGTPSRSSYLDIFTQADLLRPGLLGQDWAAFARDYDEPVLSPSGHVVPGRCRKSWQLALLLRDAVMVRRRKSEVLSELPPKVRRLVPLGLSGDLSRQLTELELSSRTDYERCGLLKLAAAHTWLREKLEFCVTEKRKAVVFAHHLRVLDRICRMASGLELVRIDGSTPPITRQGLIAKFMAQDGPSLAVIGVTACAVGVDLSAASLAIFAELPPDASWLCQAEDRLHRQGQQQAVDVLLLLAAPSPRRKGPWSGAEVARAVRAEEQRWAALRRRLREVSTLHDQPAPQAGLAETGPPTAPPSQPAQSDPSDASTAFAFEVSPYTQRVHVFLEGRALGSGRGGWARKAAELGLSPAQGQALEAQAAEFQRKWQELSPYQQRLSRGTAHQASFEAPASPALRGSKRRFAAYAADEAKALPRCEVRVRYTFGRLSGRALTFLPPVETGRLLCMECLRRLEGLRPEELPEFRSPTGERVTHRCDGENAGECQESDLFCGGECRARFFGQRQGASLRRQLFELERGVCQKCGLDCHELWQRLIPLEPAQRLKRLEE
ncbi:unnamed protein product, partial [Effrenium voratum]